MAKILSTNPVVHTWKPCEIVNIVVGEYIWLSKESRETEYREINSFAWKVYEQTHPKSTLTIPMLRQRIRGQFPNIPYDESSWVYP